MVLVHLSGVKLHLIILFKLIKIKNNINIPIHIFISTRNYIIMNIDLLEKQFLQEYKDIIESLNINFDKQLTRGRPVKYLFNEQKKKNNWW